MMITAMIRELGLNIFDQPDAGIQLISAQHIETIYFGGGTPSLLTGNEIKKLLDAVYDNFHVEANAEVTLEANPDDINRASLAQWKEAGINRLSIGVQSFSDTELEWMNRAHNATQALQSIQLAKDEGFSNFSVDLIYGTPGLESGQWEKNIRDVINMEVPHLSCYALTVEPGTALNKMIALKKKENIDMDLQSSQFLLMANLLEDAGYEHYEISNFARPGARSRHNSSYWQAKNYIGIGPSAHSFNGRIRRWNVSNNSLYVESIFKNIIPSESELLSYSQQLNEYIMTSLRTMEGLDLNFIKSRFGREKSKQLNKLANKFIVSGKAKTEGSKIILTNDGKLFADGIAAELFFD